MTYLNIIEPDSCWPWKCCKSTMANNDGVYIRADSSVVKFDHSRHEEDSLSKCLDRITTVFLQQVGQRIYLGQYINRIATETGINEGRFYLMTRPFTKLEIEQIKDAMSTIHTTRIVTIPATVVVPVLADTYIN